MTTTQVTRLPVRVETRGKVSRRMAERAAVKIDSLLRRAPGPVLSTRVTLTMAANRATEQPAVASVNVDMNGRFVRAQATSESMGGAIEQLVSRLRVRLDRAGLSWTDVHGSLPPSEPDGWRHRKTPAHRPVYFPRTAAERSLIRQASRASGTLTAAEAAAELDLLDYDFLVFIDASTGADAMISRSGGDYPVILAEKAPRLVAADAITRLDALGEQFMFFLDADSGRGNVIYHRYDGHYGLLTPPTPTPTQTPAIPESI